jgi:hypothetical protein
MHTSVTSPLDSLRLAIQHRWEVDEIGCASPDPFQIEKPVRFRAQSSQSVALDSRRSPQVPHKLKNRTPCADTSRAMLGRAAEKSGTMTGGRGACRDARHASQRFQKRRTNDIAAPLGHGVRPPKKAVSVPLL